MKKQLTDARQAPFVWFDVKLDDAGLSPYAFRLYCRIARRTAGGKTNFFEALTNAASACRMSERQARYAIKDLLRFKMVQCVQKLPGYPTIYALTDKSEWVFPTTAPDAPLQEMQPPLHLMQPSPAPSAVPPAPDAALPLHLMQPKKTHGRNHTETTHNNGCEVCVLPAENGTDRSAFTIRQWLAYAKTQPNINNKMAFANAMAHSRANDGVMELHLEIQRQAEERTTPGCEKCQNSPGWEHIPGKGVRPCGCRAQAKS